MDKVAEHVLGGCQDVGAGWQTKGGSVARITLTTLRAGSNL